MQTELARVNGTDSATSNSAGIIQSLWGTARQPGKPATGLLAVLLHCEPPPVDSSAQQLAESLRQVLPLMSVMPR